MLKKSLSASGGWGVAEEDDTTATESQDSHAEKKLTKSQSEKWGRKKGSNRRQHMKRANSLDISATNDDNNNVFDWKAFRKDKRRGDFQRSKSDRWASNPSSVKSSDHDKPPTVRPSNSFRRAQSELWSSREGRDSKPASLLAAHAPCDASDAFDWKAFRKDRRRTMKKSKSESIMIGVAS